MTPPESTLSHLDRPESHSIFEVYRPQTNLVESRSPFSAHDDLAALRMPNLEQGAQRQRDLWRWVELLVVRSGAFQPTPCGGDAHPLYVKDDSLNPTASLKGRGEVMAILNALELGGRILSSQSPAVA